MSNKFLKNNNLYIASKKAVYIKFTIIFILVILASVIFIYFSNNFLLSNLKSSYERNYILNNQVNELKNILDKKTLYIKKLEDNNKEISGIFNKYTDAVKFKIATAEEIQSRLFEKDEKILELNRDINYYKFLLNGKENKEPISISQVKTSIAKKNSILNYSFLLLSNVSEKKIKGNYKFYIDGFIKKNNKSIKRKKINLSNNSISFKNYLKLEGAVNLPAGIEIIALYIDVQCNGKIYNYKHVYNLKPN
tara:strand:+ start:1748 stop:2497 length:750 start_codon:yes stop_codon:yes gene_type:complete